jgi:hypothetical protein
MSAPLTPNASSSGGNENNNKNDVMTPEERRANCEAYIDSDAFGMDTWVTITLFNENVNNVITTMRMYHTLLNNNGLLSGQLPDIQTLRITQHIVLDLILKAQIIVESSLVFLYELSTNGYRELSRRMARYTLDHVNNVVLRAIFESDIDFRLLRAMGVPPIAGMPLEQPEVTLLQSLYRQTEDNAWAQVQRLADFYDRFKMVYNKYRHGLILRTGSTRTNNNDNNSNSVFNLYNSALEALDFKYRPELPRDSIMVERDDNNSLAGMFNALSHVNISQELINEIFDIVCVAQQIISYTCAYHRLCAINCGQSYLPLTIINGQTHLTFMIPDEVYRANEEVLRTAADKVLHEMNVQESVTGERFTFRNERIVQAIQNNMVTNVFVRSTP